MVNNTQLSKLQERLDNLMQTDPMKAVSSITANINKALDELEKHVGKPHMQLQYDKAHNVLKDNVRWSVDALQLGILYYAEGKGGFENDPTGILKGKSLWSKSPALQKKYPNTFHLVDQFASEHINNSMIDPEAAKNGEFISPTAAVQIMNSTDDQVSATLTDGSEVTFDKTDNTVGIKEPGSTEVKWYKAKYDLTKDWIVGVWEFFKEKGIQFYNWVLRKWEACVQYLFGDPAKDVTPETSTVQ